MLFTRPLASFTGLTLLALGILLLCEPWQSATAGQAGAIGLGRGVLWGGGRRRRGTAHQNDGKSLTLIQGHPAGLRGVEGTRARDFGGEHPGLRLSLRLPLQGRARVPGLRRREAGA